MAAELLATATAAQQAVVPFLAGGAACLLVLGLWTPFASAVATLCEMWFAYSQREEIWPAVMSMAVTSALAFLGPGAWSLDAMAYGRRRLEESRRAKRHDSKE